MSNVKRWDFSYRHGMRESPTGEYVDASDYDEAIATNKIAGSQLIRDKEQIDRLLSALRIIAARDDEPACQLIARMALRADDPSKGNTLDACVREAILETPTAGFDTGLRCEICGRAALKYDESIVTPHTLGCPHAGTNDGLRATEVRGAGR